MNSSRCFKHICSIGLTCLIFSITSFADDLKIKSSITSVTLYNNQALITRTARENIPAGTTKIIVTNLPWGMIDQSLKVSGIATQEVKISDIKVEQIFLDTIPEGRVAELYDRLNTLRLEKNALERNNILFKSQFDAVDAVKESYTRSLGLQNPGQKASVEEWDKLLQFVEKKKSEYSDKMESTRKAIDLKLKKIEAVEEEIRATGGAAKKEQKQVSVILNSVTAGPVTLEISYLTSGAMWIPTYEVRAASAQKELQLVYSGYVRQSSGEDWNNVDLVLSTAKPTMSEDMPVLSQWTVDVKPVYRPTERKTASQPSRAYTEVTFTGNTISGKVVDSQTGEPLTGANVIVEGTTLGGTANLDGDYVIYNVPDGTYSVRASTVGYQPVMAQHVRVSKTTGAQQTFDLSPESIQTAEVVIAAERAMVKKDMTSSLSVVSADEIKVLPEISISSSKITSSTFAIASKQSIPSDNQNHKVGIAVEEIPVVFTYNVVPKLAQAAFLEGKGKNPKEYPLLAGEANVFLDNSFVASIRLKTIMPNDSFSVNLGADEGIRVERKLVNQFNEKVGTFSTKKRLTLEYENTVVNHKKYPVQVSLFDQVPVSRDERIVVETIEPDPKAMVPDADGIFKWNVTLKTGEKKTVRVKFAIEYPPEVYPYGLQ